MAETPRLKPEQAEQARQPGGLSIAVTATGDIRMLTLAGEIDHHTGETLQQALDITGTTRPRIVIDMRQVAFMDSSGINILITAHQHITQAGGWLRLAEPTPSVRRVLQLVGIDQLIDCRDTLRHALTLTP
ncbi:STAS domain-containing protein [Streptomyces sp. NPDC085946]|uniref:STAS domain-containing protein n=1 Tax=Streptomyces sp. NPDC085946 TaxID=3365744 RepID=UPI0037D17F2C